MAKVSSILEPEESPFKQNTASKTEIKDAATRILKKIGEREKINADIRGEYDAAADKGIDRGALRDAIKEHKNKKPDEHKTTVNAYLKALGDGPLFAFADAADAA